MTEAGIDFVAHHDRFAPDAPDEERLTAAADQGWLVVTRDQRIRYLELVPGAGDGRTVRIWSAPTPKWRSPRKRYCAGERPSEPRVSSSTTKSM